MRFQPFQLPQPLSAPPPLRALGRHFRCRRSRLRRGHSDSPPVSSPALAQITTDRPAGQYSFADVSSACGPPCISVRTKMDGPRTSSVEEEEGPGQNVPPNMERSSSAAFRRSAAKHAFARAPTRQPPGSGFFISADALWSPINHVIDKATTVESIMDDGKVYTAKVIGSDQRTDLGAAQIDGRTDFPGSRSRLLNRAVAIGCLRSAIRSAWAAPSPPASPRPAAATSAPALMTTFSSDRRRSESRQFRRPDFNLAGEVIGVKRDCFSDRRQYRYRVRHSAETVIRVIASLKESVSSRAFMGVIYPASDGEIAESLGLKEPQGALVADVQADSPAAKAGMSRVTL